MSTSFTSLPATRALVAVCDAAALALGCPVHGWVGSGPARQEVRVTPDAAAGTCTRSRMGWPGDPEDGAFESLPLSFAGGQGGLCWRRPRTASSWTATERGVAESLRRLAEATCAPAPPVCRPGGDPASGVDPAAYFRAVFDQADAMIWVQDPAGAFLEVSQTACEVAGYTPAEYIAGGLEGVSWGEPPFSMAEALQHLRVAEETGGPHQFEWCARHRDGRAMFVEVTLRVVTLNGARRILATGRPIDDRKAAEAELLRAYGELERRVQDRTAELAVANQELERRTAELAVANQELERRVAARTAELAAANDTLRHSEEHFRRLIGNAHDLIVIVDARGNALYGSPSVGRVLGHDPAGLVGTPMGRYIHADDRPRVRDWLRGLGGGPAEARRVEFRFRHADGGWAYLEAVSTAGADPGAGYVVNLRDVTERRHAEEELRRTEEYYRTLIECSHDIITVVERDGTIAFQSPAAERILGYAPNQLAGTPIFDLMHPADVDAARGHFERVFASPGAIERVQYRVRRSDGTWRHLESFGRTVRPDSAAAGAVGNARDITERLESERALRESEERFRTLTENAHDIIAIVDARTGALRYQSPAMERLLGYSPAEMAGRNAFDLVHPDDRAGVRGAVAALVAAPGSTRHGEYRYLHRDGSWRYMETFGRTLSPATADDGLVFNTRDVTARKRAELAVLESEAKYRSLVDAAQDMITVIDADGVLRFQSPSVRRILGYEPEEMVGRSAFDFMHPDDTAALVPRLRAVMTHPGTVECVEHRFRHKDGSWRYLESRGRTILPDSAAAGAVAMVRDVTERMESERALRESEERFRTLIENSHDIIVVIDGGTGELRYQSPSMERILGYAPGDLAGQNAFALVHPDDAERITGAIGAALAEPGSTRHAEYRYRHKDGSWRHLETFGRTLSAHTARDGLVFNTRDVTERRVAEHALQESEEHFRRLIENANDLLMIAGPDLAIHYVSPSAQRLLGYTPAEMANRTPAEMLHPDDLSELAVNMDRVMADPEYITRATWRIRHRDGGWRLFEALGRMAALHDDQYGFVINARDITDRVAAEDAMRQAKAEAERAREDAERANRAKSEFLSRMSHELRTPLNSILGFAQVLEDVDMAAEYRAGLRHILGGGRHLLRLINEVLDIARIEADQQALSLEPVRLGLVIREAVDMVRPLAAARGIRVVEVSDGSADGYVHADRQRLAQVLLNLLSNAVKYNRTGGEVWISYERLPTAEGCEWLRVRVADQGSGILPEHQDRLFVPFARLGAENTGIEGTGLGLALSQHLARAMGGALGLERTGPDGSVFHVDLRCAPDPLSDARALVAQAEAVVGAGEAPGTLLYVEDNLANLSLVQTIILPRPRWRLIPALQGRLGLDLAEEHAPDVILLDLHLPDMPGREVLRHLRANPRTAHIPVVIITADATPKTAEALIADGADAFLTKPLGVAEFLSTVQRLLTRAPAG